MSDPNKTTIDRLRKYTEDLESSSSDEAIVSQLSRKQKDAIESLAWGMKHFGSLVTNRHVRRSTVLMLVKRGIAESVGDAAMCDGDGFTIQPERYREGFRLTHHGVEVHTAVMADYEKQFQARCGETG